MEIAKIPENENERLKELFEYELLDTAPEQEFDCIVKLASQICGVPISLITLVDTHRQWFKANLGLDVNETSRDSAFCAHTILQDKIMIVEDTWEDKRFADNPLVLESPNIRFYAGVPLISPKGLSLGSLCVIDTSPKQLDEDQIFALETLAKSVIKQFELKLQIKHLEKVNKLKDRLLSIMSHDLRGPLNNLRGIIYLLNESALKPDERAHLIEEVKKALNNSQDLLENLLVWASNQIEEKTVFTEINIRSLVQEQMSDLSDLILEKNNTFINAISDDFTYKVDANLVSMIVRNLLHNANKFTDNGHITCKANIGENRFLNITVEDTGIGMSKEKLDDLFNWENKQSLPGTNDEKGAGIGLLLCKDYIERQGGKIKVESKEGKGSVFSFSVKYEVE